MDHPSSIITQVSRDEEENATCREEGEFGRSLQKFSAAHDKVREAPAAVRSGATVSLMSPGGSADEPGLRLLVHALLCPSLTLLQTFRVGWGG